MKRLTLNLSSLIVCALLLTSCQKEYTDPTSKEVATGQVMTIAEVRALYQPGQTIVITEDISVYGVVTMDETSGNLYKESYMSDATGNLYMRFISGSGLYTGDSIRVNINGAKILKYNQMLQVDSLHPDNSVVKVGTQQFKTPEVVSISSLSDGNGDPLESSQGKLIQLNSVRFIEGGQGVTYADAANQSAESRYLEDVNGVQVEVRTSGYANFANDTLPSGVGTFIGIVAQYNSGLQLLVRDPNELTLNGTPPVVKDFEDGSITSGGWSTQQVVGIYDWAVDVFGGNSFAKISNYAGSNTASEAWLISPSIDLSASTAPTFSFSSDYKYTGPTMEVLVSTDYDGVSAPSSANWAAISAPLDTDGNNWGLVGSGLVSLSGYTGNANVYIAFKYTGTNSDGSTWEVDNVIINN